MREAAEGGSAQAAARRPVRVSGWEEVRKGPAVAELRVAAGGGGVLGSDQMMARRLGFARGGLDS